MSNIDRKREDCYLFQGPLPLDKIHDLAMSPMDLTEPEFLKFLACLSANTVARLLMRTISDDGRSFEDLGEALLNIDFFESKAEFRKMVKNKGFFINKIQVTEKMQFHPDMFYHTGIIDYSVDPLTYLKYCIVRKGKRDFDFFIAHFPVDRVKMMCDEALERIYKMIDDRVEEALNGTSTK